MKRIFELSLAVSGMFMFPSFLAAQDSTAAVYDGKAFLEQLQPRDSVLVGDQLKYGFELGEVAAGTGFMLPDYSGAFCPGVEVVSPWSIDTVKVLEGRKKDPKLMDIRGSVTVTSFDEGRYELPPISIVRISPEGRADTLYFSPEVLDVRTMPVDTSAFEVRDIKGQIRYPVGFIRKRSKVKFGTEPAHIVALRKLDKLRGDSLWAPEKQKVFYSGITDAMREYIASRYGISAMEMTTKEIFDSLKDRKIPDGLYADAKDLFERADYVKFAKYTASQQENASAVPSAVKFVTSTYQEELDEESAPNASGTQAKEE